MARPRSEEAHRSALTAAVELLIEGGVEAFNLDQVAARSGVAKTTLYRHFGDREGLLAAAAASCAVTYTTPDTGSLEQDLLALFAQFQGDGQARINALLPLLLDASRRDETIREIVHDLVQERKRPLRTILQLAQHRGEIRADLDLDTVQAMIIGPLTYRRTIEERPIDAAFVGQVLATVIAGLRATAEPGSGAA